ncbi:unnamed protein product [Symbiodinium sp. CCMP2592]|nr:unnamed protein product [Symbiodinium sp. CCMP2592]
MEAGGSPDADLGPQRRETPHLRERREQFNRVRRTSPLLQQLRGAAAPPLDNRGHMLEWTGGVVQHIHDLHAEGFLPDCCVPLIRQMVLERRFAEYESAAAHYLRNVESQIGTYMGCHAVCRLDTACIVASMDLIYEVEAAAAHQGRYVPRRRSAWRRRRTKRLGAENGLLCGMGSHAVTRAREHHRRRDLYHGPSITQRQRHERGPPQLRPRHLRLRTWPQFPWTRRLTHGCCAWDSDMWTTRSVTISSLLMSRPASATPMWSHNMQDRQVLMLAIHRLVLRLLAAMGDAIQTAVTHEREETMEVAVEEDDEYIYMQMPKDFPDLLLALLEHRCANNAAGWFLGHSGGNVGMTVAVLATFVGDANSNDWARCSEDGVKWALQWAQRLQVHLPQHPGSRQARGLVPCRGPVMLFSKPIPDDIDSDGVEGRPFGALAAAPADAILLGDSHESGCASGPTEPSSHGLTNYLVGLRTPSPASAASETAAGPRKVRVLMVEVSSGSADVPRRTLRLPLRPNGTATVQLQLGITEEEDQDEIATQPAGKKHRAISADLVSSLADSRDLTDEQILRLYGNEVLDLVQVRRALMPTGSATGCGERGDAV